MSEDDLHNSESRRDTFRKEIAERVREIDRPTLLGESPSNDAQRSGYIFTQAIRSDAVQCGIPFHSLQHFVVSICGAPAIPKSNKMDAVLDVAKSYVRASTATNEANEVILFADADGEILLKKSTDFPSGFSFRFRPARDCA